MGLFGWFGKKPETGAPVKLTLRDVQYFLDGGTILLSGTDERGRERQITLVQNAMPGRSDAGIRGRLYLEGQLVPGRSDLESQILTALREAEVDCPAPPPKEAEPQPPRRMLILGDDIKQVMFRGPEDNIRALRDQVIKRVESPDYPGAAER